MALGRQTGQQGEMILTWDELPKSPGHVFYDRLQAVLREAGFDAFAEDLCRPYYAAVLGAPSLPPGRYFRMHLVGYFEGIASERGLEWRWSRGCRPWARRPAGWRRRSTAGPSSPAGRPRPRRSASGSEPAWPPPTSPASGSWSSC